MITYSEIRDGLTAIRKVLNIIEVKGTNNAKAISVIDEHCSILIDDITKAIEENQNESKSDSGEEIS